MTARGLAFGLCFFFWTVVECLAFAWVLLLPRPPVLKYLYQYLRSLGWIERHVAGITYRIVGDLPRHGPALIAMKHQSTWETMKLHLLFDDPCVVMKKELMQLPLWGRYARALDMIPIDRKAGNRAMAMLIQGAQKAVAQKRPVVIFPQGTRVPHGEFRPYKGGIGKIYEATGLPIMPIALNSGLFWPKKLFAQRSGVITVEVLEAIPPGLSAREATALLEMRLEAASNRLIEDERSDG